MLLKLTTTVALCLCAASVTMAQIDGSLGGTDTYGGPLATQDNETNFGDNTDPSAFSANGSELDVAYGEISGGNLNLLITGNLESNFNKLEIFVDTGAGGQNQLAGGTGVGALDRMGDDGGGNGLTFDTGFDADYWFSVTIGNSPVNAFVDWSPITGGGGFVGQVDIENGGTGPHPLSGSGISLTLGVDNSNLAGVPVGTGTGSGAGVTTGVEISIPLASIGSPAGDIDVVVFINGSNHDLLSNQTLGGLGGGSDNLGEPRNVDFSSIGGDQFFTVAAAVPEPGSLAFFGLAGLALLLRRRVRR